MSSNSEIKLSIAIVTRNRPDSLEETLISLAAQSVRPFEILISDDSNEQAFRIKTRELAKKFDCIYIEGPQKGLYANRNFVARKCTGTHFRTMDDDHYFPVDHLEKCIEAIQKEPDIIWTIGEYYPESKNRPVPPPIPGQLHPRGFAKVPDNMNEYYGISCGGTIYPSLVVDKEILNCEIYRFGNTFLEYGARLKSKGFQIKFLPDTYFVHNAVATSASELTSRHINEARLFSMFALSFDHQRNWWNILQTIGQVFFEICTGNNRISEVLTAYRNFRHFKLLDRSLKY